MALDWYFKFPDCNILLLLQVILTNSERKRHFKPGSSILTSVILKSTYGVEYSPLAANIEIFCLFCVAVMKNTALEHLMTRRKITPYVSRMTYISEHHFELSIRYLVANIEISVSLSHCCDKEYRSWASHVRLRETTPPLVSTDSLYLRFLFFVKLCLKYRKLHLFRTQRAQFLLKVRASRAQFLLKVRENRAQSPKSALIPRSKHSVIRAYTRVVLI